jgi:hypothetical protein
MYAIHLFKVPGLRRAWKTRTTQARPEKAGKNVRFRVAMRPGKRRCLTDTAEGKLQDLIETAKAHIRSKGEHPFHVIKQQFGLHKTRRPLLATG